MGWHRPGSGYDMGAYEYAPTHRLHYIAEASGSIVGSATQVVRHGTSGVPSALLHLRRGTTSSSGPTTQSP